MRITAGMGAAMGIDARRAMCRRDGNDFPRNLAESECERLVVLIPPGKPARFTWYGCDLLS